MSERKARKKKSNRGISHARKLTARQRDIKRRLEYLRGELRAERISYEELAELQSLAAHIDPGDVELLEPAGVPEGAVVARCGSSNEHGAHMFPDGKRTRFCAGNKNLIVAR